jgi:hypothetical protein
MIRMPNGQLKQVGDYPMTIALHSDVTANITVSVLGEASDVIPCIIKRRYIFKRAISVVLFHLPVSK